MSIANVLQRLGTTTIKQPRAAPAAAGRTIPVPGPVTILKHCRCVDCRRFHKSLVGDSYYCDSLIGGTRIVYDTLERYCDPPPEAWHYCRDYRGPAISKETLMWKYKKTA